MTLEAASLSFTLSANPSGHGSLPLLIGSKRTLNPKNPKPQTLSGDCFKEGFLNPKP